MDLPNIETYLQPSQLTDIGQWQKDWCYLAGGTWLFAAPQPQIKALVDLEGLGWSDIDITPTRLVIGATCPMVKLAQFQPPETWTSFKALKAAVKELASFKIQNMATVGGNICLALPASTFAPVMVALGANYEIISPHSQPYEVAAIDFQIGAQQTILKPGELLRKIVIPQTHLDWQIHYERICLETAGYALSIVVTAYHLETRQIRFGLGACTPAPRLIEFSQIPTLEELNQALDTAIPLENFIDDDRASAAYRRHITQILMHRGLAIAPPVSHP